MIVNDFVFFAVQFRGFGDDEEDAVIRSKQVVDQRRPVFLTLLKK